MYTNDNSRAHVTNNIPVQKIQLYERKNTFFVILALGSTGLSSYACTANVTTGSICICGTAGAFVACIHGQGSEVNGCACLVSVSKSLVEHIQVQLRVSCEDEMYGL